jgi:hypothetical protein
MPWSWNKNPHLWWIRVNHILPLATSFNFHYINPGNFMIDNIINIVKLNDKLNSKRFGANNKIGNYITDSIANGG